MTQEQGRGSLLGRVFAYAESEEGGKEYRESTEAERAQLKKSADRFLKNCTRIDQELLREQTARFELQPGEFNKPHIGIVRMFRTAGGGKYLNFSGLTNKILDRFHNPMKYTIYLYGQHMAKYGLDSIANLCIDGPAFYDLTHGLELYKDGISEDIKIDTIEELRVFIEVLKTPDLRLFRKREYLKDERVYFSGAYNYIGESIHKNNMLDHLELALAEWDTIGENSAPDVSTQATPGV